MSNIAVEVNHVWKKFHRGEFNDSLRDAIPALAKRLLRRGPKREGLTEGDRIPEQNLDLRNRAGR